MPKEPVHKSVYIVDRSSKLINVFMDVMKDNENFECCSVSENVGAIN